MFCVWFLFVVGVCLGVLVWFGWVGLCYWFSILVIMLVMVGRRVFGV